MKTSKKSILNYSILTLLFLVANTFSMSSKVRFGAKGGFDVIEHRIDSKLFKSKNKLGFQFGPSLDINILPSGLGLDLSVLYGYQKYEIMEKDDANQLTISNYHYVSIPLNLKQKFMFNDSFGLFGVAGVYGAVKIDGQDLEYAYEEFKSKRFHGGINLGAGVSVFNNFDLGMYYRQELTKNYSINKPGFEDLEDLNKEQEKDWSVMLTYYF